MTALGERLESKRGNATQRQFAKLLDIPLTSYTNWINGPSSPKMEHIIKICTRLGVSSDWLLGLSPTGGTPTVNAGSGAAVNIGSGSATAGGDCSKCQLMQAHVRQITGRA